MGNVLAAGTTTCSALTSFQLHRKTWLLSLDVVSPSLSHKSTYGTRDWLDQGMSEAEQAWNMEGEREREEVTEVKTKIEK